jgi:hypothetical protein
MPALWSRRVIFAANFRSLFFGNQEETAELRERVGSLRSYGGRIVPILNLIYRGGDNLLLVETEPEACLLEYFRETLGLELPSIALLPPELLRRLGNAEPLQDFDQATVARVASHPAEWVDGVMVTDGLEQLAEQTSKQVANPARGSRLGNDKLRLHQALAAAGLPTFDTETADNPAAVAVCLQRLAGLGYQRAAVKSSIGASGVGIRRVELSEREEIPDYFFKSGPCMVQGWLDDSVDGARLIGSPSVQLFLTDQSVCLFDLTDQILGTDAGHEGNCSPPPSLVPWPGASEELYAQSAFAGRWLHQQEYRGPASIDFHLLERDGKLEVRICEINARVTGASYPSLLARRFRPDAAWVMRNVSFKPAQSPTSVLESLRSAGLLFRPEMEEGLMPINFNVSGSALIGKAQILGLAANVERAEALFARMREAGAIPWAHGEDA